MSYVLSSTDINDAYINDSLDILLEEPPNNYHWELELPNSFQIIKRRYSSTQDALYRQWIISPTMPGDFTLYCHYRKMCCGKPIMKTVSYRVIVR